jgi:transcriptional regulator with XRE-family HTH domain
MSGPKRRKALIEVLKDAIRESGQSLTQLGKASRVSPGQLSRFMRDERSLSLEATEKVCTFLRLTLVREQTEQPEASPEKPGRGPRKGK